MQTSEFNVHPVVGYNVFMLIDNNVKCCCVCGTSETHTTETLHRRDCLHIYVHIDLHKCVLTRTIAQLIWSRCVRMSF